MGLFDNAEFLNRLARDLGDLHTRLEVMQGQKYLDSEEGLRAQLGENQQAIVDGSVLMGSLARLKMSIAAGYESSGRFDFKAIKTSSVSELESVSSSLRAILYSLQERSKALRYLFQRHLAQPTFSE